MEEIKCKTCGKFFQPQRTTAKYCSDTCRYHDFLTKKKRITIPRDLRYSILMRDNFRCQYCGATPQMKELRVDHIVSIKEGGAVTDPSNLITACDPCNAGKGERSADPKLVGMPRESRNSVICGLRSTEIEVL